MKPSHHLTPGADDELNWLAFRYVAGEMTEEESESFESRLANELAVCEAVAAMSDVAVSSRDAIAAEESFQPVRRVEDRHSIPVRIRSWFAVGSTLAALGWLFVLLSIDRSPPMEQAETVTPNDSYSAAELVARWSQVEAAEDHEELPEILPVELSVLENEPPEIPGWMIAAVTLEAETTPDSMSDPPSDTNPVEMKEN